MRLAENLQRKDVDPVDEASYVGEIMLRTKKNPQGIAEMLHRTPEWIETRLAVFALPDYLQAYLKTKQLSLGAALELGKIKAEQTRTYYSHYAAQNGVSVATAKRWALEANEAFERRLAAPTLDPQSTRGQPPAKIMLPCAQCGRTGEMEAMTTVWVHMVCPEPAEGISEISNVGGASP